MLAHWFISEFCALPPSASAIPVRYPARIKRSYGVVQVFPTTRYPRGYHGCGLDPWYQPDQDTGRDLPS